MHLWYKFKEFSRFSENLTSGHWDLNSSEIFSTFPYGMYFKILPQLILKIFRILDLCPWGQSIWEWNSSETFTRSTYSMNLDMLHGSFSSYCIHKIFKRLDLWHWIWGQGHWNWNLSEILCRCTYGICTYAGCSTQDTELLNWAICEPMYTKWSSSSFSLSLKVHLVPTKHKMLKVNLEVRCLKN